MIAVGDVEMLLRTSSTRSAETCGTATADRGRPVPRRVPPAGHHAREARVPRRPVDRIAGEPRASRGRRRAPGSMLVGRPRYRGGVAPFFRAFVFTHPEGVAWRRTMDG